MHTRIVIFFRYPSNHMLVIDSALSIETMTASGLLTSTCSFTGEGELLIGYTRLLPQRAGIGIEAKRATHIKSDFLNSYTPPSRLKKKCHPPVTLPWLASFLPAT